MPPPPFEEREGLCPYCYTGTMVKDRAGVIFCNQCGREILLRVIE